MKRKFFEWIYQVPLCLGLALVMVWLAIRLSKSPNLPNVEHWGVILGGICLVAGALFVAWGEKQLLSEHAYQYSTMLDLYHLAWVRADRELRLIKSLADALRDLTGDHRDVQAQTLLRMEFDHKVGEFQDFLYELGVEALDENAEWLILYRSRPLEPVMAG